MYQLPKIAYALVYISLNNKMKVCVSSIESVTSCLIFYLFFYCYLIYIYYDFIIKNLISWELSIFY